MTKKIDTKSLVNKIEKVVRDRMREQNIVSLKDFRKIAKKDEPPTILVVEDDETVRKSIQRLLEKESFKVVTAADGPQLSLVLDDSPIDLIILDVNLPWVNGFELASLMKEHQDLKSIPLIFVSGMTQEADIKKGFQVGADDYIKKPYDVEELRRSVLTLLALNKA